MSVSYKREINHNYLIIDASEQAAAGYECRMLAGNTIEGLLKFRVRHHEDKKEFYYEITSKQPLSRLLEQRTITGDEIRALMLGISGLIDRLEEYLLQEDQIYLKPEYIYIEPDRFSVFFCMVPGYCGSFPKALTTLFEYLLSKVNHQDKNGVMLAYNLYHESLKENYGMQDLLGFLNENSSGIFSAEKPVGGQNIIRGNTEFATDKEITMDKEIATNKEIEIEEKIKINKKDEINHFSGKGFPWKIILRFIMITAVGELALWFLIGVNGLLRYGVWILAGMLVLSGIYFLSNMFFSAEKIDILSSNIENRQEKKENIGQTFKIVQEEDQEERWTDWKESDKMEIIQEPQTELLADLDKPKRLAVLEGLNKDQGLIEITYLPFVIGKHEELSDYCLCQPTVSRLHLRVDKKEEVFIVTDLNSTNGTIVEGHHLEANETVSIKNGDIIYLADAGFRFIEDKM